MELKELRMEMMRSKKSNPERAKVLSAILSSAQLIAKEDKNREVTPKDIIAAVKKEVKIANQSKESGAPYSEMTFVVAEEFLPKLMSEDELKVVVETIVNTLVKAGNEKSPKMMGTIMGILKKEYTDLYDGRAASEIVKSVLV